MNSVEKRAINLANFSRAVHASCSCRAYRPLRNNKPRPPLRFTTSHCNLIRSSSERLYSIDVRQEADRSRMSVSGRQPFEIANNSGTPFISRRVLSRNPFQEDLLKILVWSIYFTTTLIRSFLSFLFLGGIFYGFLPKMKRRIKIDSK